MKQDNLEGENKTREVVSDMAMVAEIRLWKSE
jgi:hypothetical protein